MSQRDKFLESKGINPQAFCVMPFVTMILEPNGSVGFCRHKGTKFSFGNIKNQNIWEIWNGPKVIQWRNEFLNGRVEICKDEVSQRRCNECSQLNQILPDAVLEAIQPQRILRFTANFNGKCNLQCRMCDVWQMPNGLYDDINFWEPARKEIFPFLKEVDLLSGEPFIQSDTYRLIDEISQVNAQAWWTFTTNAHWNFNERIESYLNKINIKNIILSIDSLTPEIYAIIRPPGKLEKVLNNIDKLLLYNQRRIKSGGSNLNFKANFLIQKNNWHELGAMIDFCLDKTISPFMTFLYAPEVFSLLSLSEYERMKILHYYLEHLSKKQILYSRRILLPLFNSLSKSNRFDMVDLFSLNAKSSNDQSITL